MEPRTLYRADDCTVTKTTGTKWPDNDADGEKIFENRHFVTEVEAWVQVLDEARAGVHLSGRAVIDARERLRDAEQRAASDAARFSQVQDNFADWKRKH